MVPTIFAWRAAAWEYSVNKLKNNPLKAAIHERFIELDE